jgi:hypothetical protein
MREGPAGFQEALWPDGTVEQSEAPNVLLMAKEAAMKRPAACIKRPATKKKTTKTQKTNPNLLFLANQEGRAGDPPFLLIPHPHSLSPSVPKRNRDDD